MLRITCLVTSSILYQQLIQKKNHFPLVLHVQQHRVRLQFTQEVNAE